MGSIDPPLTPPTKTTQQRVRNRGIRFPHDGTFNPNFFDSFILVRIPLISRGRHSGHPIPVHMPPNNVGLGSLPWVYLTLPRKSMKANRHPPVHLQDYNGSLAENQICWNICPTLPSLDLRSHSFCPVTKCDTKTGRFFVRTACCARRYGA